MNEIDQLGDGNRAYLRKVTRKMLERLERSLDAAVQDEDLSWYLKSHELVFGAKASLAATLVTLAELLMQLDEPAAAEEDEASPSRALSAADITLVDAFVRRIKSTQPLKGDLFS